MNRAQTSSKEIALIIVTDYNPGNSPTGERINVNTLHHFLTEHSITFNRILNLVPINDIVIKCYCKSL